MRLRGEHERERDPKHLTTEAMNALTMSPADTENGKVSAEIRAHVAGCSTCRLMLEECRLTRQIGKLRTSVSQPCPHAEDDWISLAAGLLPSAKAQAMSRHAASCDTCAEQLREALDILHSTPSADDARFLAELERRAAANRGELASRLAGLSRERPARGRHFGWPIAWKFAGVCLAVLAVALGLRYWLNPARSADMRIAEAYRDNRIIEMRFPGALFGPLKQARRLASNEEDSVTLDEAKTVVDRQIKQHADAPRWLQRKGRLLLLSARPDEAVTVLSKAEHFDPNDGSIRVDLASAYYERCLASGQKQDCAWALQRLNEQLAKNRGDRILLFNRALALESLQLLHEAEQDWRSYLALDPEGRWADEAKRHLRALEERKKQSSLYWRGSPAAYSIEAAMDLALVNAVSACRNTNGNCDSAATAANAQLASKLLSQHSDPWLGEVLRNMHDRSTRQGAGALAKAIQADSKGDFASTQVSLREALQRLNGSDNRAAVLRAAAERVYLLHRWHDEQHCFKAARQIEPSIERNHFLWLAGFVHEEAAGCLAAEEQFRDARQEALQAGEFAEKGRYAELALRVQGLRASIEHEIGNFGEVWNIDVAGLEQWWSGRHLPLRAYQFYMDLCLSAREQGLPSIALAMAREAEIQAVAARHDLAERFAVLEHARAALDVHEWGEAQQTFAKADALSANADMSYQAEVQMGLAQLNTIHRQFQLAESRLNNVAGFVQSTGNAPLSLEWIEAAADIAAKRQQWQKHDTWLRVLVSLANAGAASLSSEADRVRWESTIESAHRSLAAGLWRGNRQMDALAVLEQMRGAYREAKATRAVQNLWVPWTGEAALARRLVQEDSGPVICYATIDGAIRIWLYGNGSIHWASSSLADNAVEAIATRLSEQSADPRSSVREIRGDSRRLYSALISPIQAWLPRTGRLIVEADRGLWAVPWEMLEGPDGEKLVQRFHIALSPGYEYRKSSNIGASIRRESAALLLIPPAQPGEPVLPDLDTEEISFRKYFLRPAIFRGPSAPWQELAQQLGRSEVIHYAGHSSVWRGHTMLELPGGVGLPHATAVSCSNLQRCRLVVLSACSTAGRSPDQVLGPESLVRPFLACGVPYVIATRWPIDSATAAQTADLFYSHLLRGLRPAAALQQALIQLSTQRETEHPFYWAGFTLFGSAD